MKHSLGFTIAEEIKTVIISQQATAKGGPSIINEIQNLLLKARSQGIQLGVFHPSHLRDEEQLQEALVLESDINPDVLLMRKNIASLESKNERYPMASMTEAAAMMGELNRTNGSKEINKAEKKGTLFTVEFFNGKRKVPIFQINQATKKPYPIIKELLFELTDHVNAPIESWLVYDWFTNPIDDNEQLTPAILICDPEAHEELLYLASQAAASMAGRIAV